MDAECVERVVVVEPRFQFRAGKKWNDARGHADHDRAGWIDISTSGRNHHQSRERTGTKSKNTWFPAQDIFQQGPGKRRDRGGKRGRGEGICGNRVGAERATGVKSVPSNPKHSSADHAKHHAVWRENFFAKTKARTEQKAEHKG